MGDLAEYLKKHYLSLHKKPENCVKDRIVKMNEHRKNDRHEKMYENRSIPKNDSPYITPKEKKRKVVEKPEPKPVSERWLRLQEYKAEKERKKKMQKQEKPIFKVCHISVNVGLPKLDNVNFEIKGKKFKSKFAPANYQFKPPSNVKPIEFQYTKTNEKKHQMTTRSQAKKSDQETVPKSKKTIKEPKQKTPKKKTETKQAKVPEKKAEKTSKKNNEKKQVKAVETKAEKTPKKRNQHKQVEEAEKKAEETPEKIFSPDYPLQEKTPEQTSPPVYISPFVTISRGKNSARKEYAARKGGSAEKSETPSCTSPRAGAAHFAWRLKNETSRLQALCDQWNKYKDEDNPPEEAVSMIDVTIGQTNLLLTKKFIQFQGLIDACREGSSDKPVTCEDLHGFWDMIHIQVDNLDKRFENLLNLKNNNWEEILPVVKKVVTKKPKTVKNAKASAGLKAAIEAARRKKLEEKEGKTPNRLSTVKNESTRKSSPGAIMFKVAQYAKNFDTPGKSILKTDGSKSAKSQSKVVIFQDEVKSICEDLENNLNVLNQSRGKTPTRSSKRLSKAKLF